MHKIVLYRDRQELQAADLNNTQAYARTAFDNLVLDIVGDLTRYVGINVSITGTTTVDVGAGRLYSRGEVYTRELGSEHDLYANLAVSTKRIVSVVTYGQSTETDVQPRDFLIDLADEGKTEPQAVSMQDWRRCQIDFVAGTEGVNPVAPAVPSNAIRVANIVLDATQIVSISMDKTNHLVSIRDNHASIKQLDNFQKRLGGRVDGLQANLLAIGRKQMSKVGMDQFQRAVSEMLESKQELETLHAEVARLRDYQRQLATAVGSQPEIAGQADKAQFFGVDPFLDDSETDTSPGDYDAVIEEGVRFGHGNTSTSQLVLLNAAEANVTRLADEGLLARYTDEVGLRTPKWGEQTGSLAVSQYTYETWNVQTRTRQRRRVRYGNWRRVCTNGARWNWRGGAGRLAQRYDQETNTFRFGGEVWEPQRARANQTHWFRARRVWEDIQTETYNVRVRNTHTIQGTQLAQTFLIGTMRYLTKVGVVFDQLGPDSGVTMMVCYADEGEPSIDQGGIAQVTVPYNQLNLNDPTYFTFAPLLLEPERRYAIVLMTAGDHHVRVEESNDVLDGDLLYYQDGQFYENTDGTGEPQALMADLQFARFKQTRATVRFNDVSLSGGIEDIDLTYGTIEPQNTRVWWEINVGGTWTRLPGEHSLQTVSGLDNDLLQSKPSSLPLRCVMQGSRTIMPTVEAGPGSRVTVQRPDKTTFKHYSTNRTLANPTTEIHTAVQYAYFEDAVHGLTVKLIDNTNGGTVLTSDTEKDVLVNAEDARYRREAIFRLGTTTSDYTIVLEGTRMATTDTPFIVESRFDYAV